VRGGRGATLFAGGREPGPGARPRAVGWQEIVAIADLGLYAAKRSGRNRWVGVQAGDAGDPQEISRRFREDPGPAVASGAVRVRAPEQGELQWV
jgi:hypothetical protein